MQRKKKKANIKLKGNIKPKKGKTNKHNQRKLKAEENNKKQKHFHSTAATSPRSPKKPEISSKNSEKLGIIMKRKNLDLVK